MTGPEFEATADLKKPSLSFADARRIAVAGFYPTSALDSPMPPESTSPAQTTAQAEVRRLDVPLRSPFKIAYETITHARNVLVRATFDDTTGYGEGAPVPAITGETQDDVLADVRGWTESLPSRDQVKDAGRYDAVSTAAGRAAAEGAVLDAAARVAEAPLCTFLRDASVADVPTSVTLPLVDEDELEPLVRRYKADGFRIFKVKAGLGVDEDLERIRRIRDLVGSSAELRVDPNQGWDREAAERALPGLRDVGVAFLEQPLARDDLEGHAALRVREEVPIMLDESIFSPDDARRAIRAEAADILNIKLAKCGGILPGLEIADLAADAGLVCMVGCMLETRVSIAQAAHLVLAHDAIQYADLDGATFLASDPVDGGPYLEDGVVHVSGTPGLGIWAVTDASEA